MQGKLGRRGNAERRQVAYNLPAELGGVFDDCSNRCCRRHCCKGRRDKRTVAKVEPPTKPDGTVAHPYADVNQCPPGTDIAIWPEEWDSLPNIPSVFSVCFVGGQSKNNNGGGLEVRGR